MDRILQGVASTIQVELTRDGTPEDPAPDSATVQIVRWSDGTTVYSGAAIDIDVPPGVFAHTLSPTDTALLDRFTATWTFTFDSVVQTVQTVVEVVGGFLFSIAEARTLKPLDDTATYTPAKVLVGRTYAEDKLERECGMAFVPRYERRVVSGDGSTSLCLRYPTRSIRSVSTVDSAGALTAYTAGQLAALRTDGISVYNPVGWSCGTGNFVIGYEHGFDFPPSGAAEAALLLAKQKIVRGPVDDRATQRPTEFGPINLATPGMFGSITGLPEVDEFIRATRVPGIA